MRLAKKITTNTLWQIIARVFSSGTSFIVTLIIARALGINGYGDLAKITAFVSVFYLFIDLGLNAVFLQLDGHEKRFRDLFYFRLFLAGCLFLLVGLGGFLLPYDSVNAVGYSPIVRFGIFLFSLSFLGRAASFSTGVIFQKNYLYKLSALSTIIGSAFSLALITISISLKLQFLFIILGYTLGALAEGAFSLFFVREKLFPVKIDKGFILEVTIKSLPIAAMLLLNLIYFRVDMILLTLLKSTKDVAIYDLAYKFFDFLIALPLFLSNSLYPTLLASENNTRNHTQKLLAYTLGFALLGIIIAIPVWAFSPLIYFVKSDFFNSIFALRILTLSLPVFFATNILQWIFISKKKQKYLLFVYGASLVLNVLLNLIFIPQYGYIASAIITGVSEAGVLLALLLYAFLRKI